MTLLDFYREWLDWAEGYVDSDIFIGHAGLCHNLQFWCKSKGISFELLSQMEDEFRNADLPISYPFGWAIYRKLQVEGKLHTQKRRLNWVRKRIKELSRD